MQWCTPSQQNRHRWVRHPTHDQPAHHGVCWVASLHCNPLQPAPRRPRPHRRSRSSTSMKSAGPWLLRHKPRRVEPRASSLSWKGCCDCTSPSALVKPALLRPTAFHQTAHHEHVRSCTTTSWIEARDSPTDPLRMQCQHGITHRAGHGLVYVPQENVQCAFGVLSTTGRTISHPWEGRCPLPEERSSYRDPRLLARSPTLSGDTSQQR